MCAKYNVARFHQHWSDTSLVSLFDLHNLYLSLVKDDHSFDLHHQYIQVQVIHLEMRVGCVY